MERSVSYPTFVVSMTNPDLQTPVSSRVDEPLLEREGRVLQWSLAARLVFVSIILILTALQLVGIAPPGVIAQQDSDAWLSLAICVATVSVVALFLRHLRRGGSARKIGISVLFVDLLVLAALPWIWLNGVPGLETFPPGLVKGDLFAIALLMMIINSITLRPLYPALMAAGSVALILGVAALTLDGADVVITDSYVEHFRTPAVNGGQLATRCLILALAGAFLTAMTYSSRRAIRDTISLELTHLALKERQAELAMEGRLASINGLVAGLAHELNTPLGVLSSSLGTIDAGVRLLVQSQPGDAPETPQSSRAKRALNESTATARQGLERIHSLVESLKDFSRLDESEVQRADPRAEIDTILTLIDPQIIGSTEVVKRYEEVAPIECKPRELNQVFLTILVNAFEAMNGAGRLEIGVKRAGSDLEISIGDSGPGITEELLPQLFDITFSHKGERVAMRMGLPGARLIVERHGGRIGVQSRPGAGAMFTIALPA